MNSPIGWIGGKRALRKEIIELFPQEGVGRYIEVFFGAGWVFFGREKPPGQLEVINDRDGQIVNFDEEQNILPVIRKAGIDLPTF